jgi:hypothetical protein
MTGDHSMTDDRADGAFAWLLDDRADSPFRWPLWCPRGHTSSTIQPAIQPGSRPSEGHNPSPHGPGGLLGNVSERSERERRITTQVRKVIAAAGARVQRSP